MRKILFLLTTLLSGSLAFAQEAETTTGNELEVRVIPRFEVNPYAPTNSLGEWDYDFGCSSLYTQIEGNFGDHVSYFFSNHWLSTDPASLYYLDEDGDKSANLFRSDNLNWLDMGYVTLTFGNWDFSLGKDGMVIGTFEEDAYDYDSHAGLNSLFWNDTQVYQWGIKATWNASESEQFFVQVTSSPYSTRPFGETWYDSYGGGHMKAFALGNYSNYDWLSSIWAANMIEYAEGRYMGIIGLADQFYVGDFTLTLDVMDRITSFNRDHREGATIDVSALYNLKDKWEFFAKAGYESPSEIDYYDEKYYFGGAGVQYYPLKDSQDLRLHAVASYNNFSEMISLNFGLTYNFSLFNLPKK